MKTTGKQYYSLSLFYPHNDMRTEEAIKAILNNLDRIPIEELEKLTKKF